MKKLLTKKSVLSLSVGGVVFTYIFSNPVTFGICTNTYTFGSSTGCLDKFQELIAGLLMGTSLLTLIFSLITYKMRDEVFEHWVKFAVWGVPVLMILTYFILGGASHGGLGIASAYGGAFDALLLILLYGTFCGISIYRIVSKYRELKHLDK